MLFSFLQDPDDYSSHFQTSVDSSFQSRVEADVQQVHIVIHAHDCI